MSDRILARGWGSEVSGSSRSERRAACELEEEFGSEAEMEAFFKARFVEMIDAIGGNLDRMQAALRRMERNLEAFS